VFQDVFSKEAATKLPPHRAWDCAVDPLPGAKLTKGRVYPLSIPEQAAMEEYIQKALRQGFIRPSTSPAASSFFFVSKKDGGLRPFIDYRTLNSQTVKFRILYLWFQLPLRNSVGLVSSPNWTCEAPTTSFVSVQETSGRWPSSPLLATMNIILCRMGWLTLHQSSRDS